MHACKNFCKVLFAIEKVALTIILLGVNILLAYTEHSLSAYHKDMTFFEELKD